MGVAIRVASILAHCAIVVLLWFPKPADAATSVFHSPNDDGTPAAWPFLEARTATLHLYLDGGSSASLQEDPCFGGEGDELCGWQIQIETSGGLAFDAFQPAAGVAHALDAGRLRVVGGEALEGQLGPVKIGDLDVRASATGIATVEAGAILDNALALRRFELTAFLVAVPEPAGVAGACAAIAALAVLRRRRVRWAVALAVAALWVAPARADRDGDGVADAVDGCPNLYETAQRDDGGVDDFGPDGIGNACQCGDVDDDGRVTLLDVARLQRRFTDGFFGGGFWVDPPVFAKCPGGDCHDQSAAVMAVRQAIADQTPLPPTCPAAAQLSCNAPNEPNDAPASATVLQSRSDDEPLGSTSGTLPPGDADWYQFTVFEDVGEMAPRAVLSTSAADYGLCIFITCADGGAATLTRFGCLNGSESNDASGRPGCCSTATGAAVDEVEADVECFIGPFGGGASVDVRVGVTRGDSAPDACGPYELQYGG